MMQNFFWLPLAAGSAVFAALVAIFGKIGVLTVDPNTATLLRAVVMAIFLLVVVAATGKFGVVSQATSKDWLWIILSGLAGAISWLFYFWALKFGPAARVATIDRMSLVLVALFAALFLGEKFSWLSVVGVGLVVAGAYLLSFK